jgi:putative heme-binding domain-containing protein
MERCVRSLSALGAIVLLLVGARQLAAQGQPQDHAGQYDMSDIVFGSQLYAAQCVNCHGAGGDGVGGVNLRSGVIRRAATDRELQQLITNGIRGTAMPGFNFTMAEQTGIVAYIRNMNALDAGSVKPGDAGRGQSIVEGKGQCLTCHTLNDKGSTVAPDLSNIGASRSASMLERHLTNPSAQMMPINRPVQVTLKDGKTVKGRRLNEDTYSLQLVDERGRLVGLLKSDVREVQIGTTSPMPSYKDKLDPAELSDVIAYLLSVKGS